ncbi:unnamed protein product [Merluccius merluccius]
MLIKSLTWRWWLSCQLTLQQSLLESSQEPVIPVLCFGKLPQEAAVVESEGWQEEDQTVAQVKEWVRGNCVPGAEERKACQPAAKRLLREWSRLHIQEDVLKRKAQERHTGLSLSQIVVPANKTHERWVKYHNASGHRSIVKIEA